MYKAYKNQNWFVEVNEGLTVVQMKTRSEKGNSAFLSSAKGRGLQGFFIGTALVKTIREKPYSFFIETQINISILPIIIPDMGGVNFNAGIRYFF